MMQDFSIPTLESLDRPALEAHQSNRLKQLLASIDGKNPFYTRKLRAAGVSIASIRVPEGLEILALTAKVELVADQAEHPPFGSNLTEPIANYTRYCQTSSTTGSPLRWLDTNESWDWVKACWKAVFRGARR